MKSYHGYRLPGSTHLPGFCRAFREQVTPTYQNETLSAVAAAATMLMAWPCSDDDDPVEAARTVIRQVVNRLTFNQFGYPRNYFTGPAETLLIRAVEVLQAVQEVSAGSTRRVERTFDLDLSAVFLTDPDSEEWVYAAVRSERAPFIQVWETMPEVEPFQYWDPIAHLNGTSNADSVQRRRVWQRAIGFEQGFFDPDDLGLRWDCKHPEALVGETIDGWLTAEAVAQRVITLSRDPDAAQARRRELVERLTGTRLGRDPQ